MAAFREILTEKNMQHHRPENNFGDLAKKCLRCGLCTIVCPVHEVEADEYTAARGRNLLAREVYGRKVFDKEFKKRFEKCLLCGTCLLQCPQKIPVDLLTIAVREEMVRQIGLGVAKRFVFRYAMNDRKRFGKILAQACRFQKYLPGGEGKVRHLPTFLFGLGANRRVPEIAPVFLRDQIPQVSSPAENIGIPKRVGLFMGCAIDYLFPELGKKMIRFLNRHGIEVVTPLEQGCCSLPVMAAGDSVTARAMAEKNIEAFKDLDLILTGCATCSSALKDYATFFSGADDLKGLEWDPFVCNMRDFSEFFVRDLHLPRQALAANPGHGQELKVTYHDPCHLGRFQGITAEPRQIISSLPGIDFIEMDGADRCCGMGGSFGILYYDLSKKIADQKAIAIQKTGADAVVTTCPGCRMQLVDALQRHGLKQKVLHLVELLEPGEE